ncbi:extracellular solute-binding protein [Virgibacillus chiguensis]|uniref:Putative aldouronate transport system substrate-binding protein n=1 Tax=Virgibacillus chiguensis TaxID=411959 RepID=A0A1M5U6J1_9BACI|nr:extracellular solute-binding protein [Virgibacillus chiguensis]SHH58548.1 putative aldouronate transport system substrate-binding protein [Virgibacillus chiguensis]
MVKRVLMVIVGALLFTFSLSACSKDKEEEIGGSKEAVENVTEEELPIVKEPIELDIFAGKAATTADDWNDVLLLNEYEEMTNVNITWNQVPADGLDEKRNLALASGDLPDAFYAANVSISDIQTYGAQGTFIPLNDLLEEYAPNISKVLDENPDIRKGLTFPDGNIYSVPTVYSPDFLSLLIGAKGWINGDWLEQLEMENPETTEEFYAYLKAVKETDLNGNGKNDEIPLSSVAEMSRIIHWISGAFGVQNKGQLHTLVDEDPATGNIRFFPVSASYKEMLVYLNRLFEEGLIEQNIYTLEVDQHLGNAADNLYGAVQFFNPIELYGNDVGSQFIPGNALEGPNGDKMYTGITSPLRSLGNFIITSENENPEATLKWLDYFWSDEGAKMFFMGMEGVTYEETDDGPQLVEEITNHPDGLTLTQALAQYIINPGGNHPVMVTDDYFTGSENAPSDKEAAKNLEPHLIEEIWPSFTYTAEENEELSILRTDLEKYVNEMQAAFITGEKDFSEWESYVETVENMNLDKYMEIQKQAYDRYKEN